MKHTGMIRNYADLALLETFENRFQYLKLGGNVGVETFGFDRWINQRFYQSREWKMVRDAVIVRDNGCDLGVPGYEIPSGALVHHMNPMSQDDIVQSSDWILDPNYLILVSHSTHNAIHFGVDPKGPPVVRERTPGDTKLW